MINFNFIDYAAYKIRYHGILYAVNKGTGMKRVIKELPGGRMAYGYGATTLTNTI